MKRRHLTPTSRWPRLAGRLARSILLPAVAGLLTATGTPVARSAAQAPTAERPAIRVAAQNPVGIAASSGRMWVTDAGTGEVIELNPATGDPIGKFKLALAQPKGLAFDGQRLWVADQATRQIVAHDVTDGKPLKTIPVRWPEERGFKTIEALAWDGTALWTAIAAGFSSTFNRVDADSGQIIRSVFADCNPRCLAFDASVLFSLCFNGDTNPATVDQRQVAAQEAEMAKTRRLIQRVPAIAPAGLAFDGTRLLILDANGKQAIAVRVDRKP
jgi:outer membrane protein assembly factor BamB